MNDTSSRLPYRTEQYTSIESTIRNTLPLDLEEIAQGSGPAAYGPTDSRSRFLEPARKPTVSWSKPLSPGHINSWHLKLNARRKL